MKRGIVIPLLFSALLLALGAIQMIYLHELDLRVYAIWPFNYQLSVIISKVLLSLYFIAAVMIWRSPKITAKILVFNTVLWFVDILTGDESSSWQLGSLLVGQPMHWFANLPLIACFIVMGRYFYMHDTKFKFSGILITLILAAAIISPHVLYWEPDSFTKPDINTTFNQKDHSVIAGQLSEEACSFVILSSGCGHCIELARALAIKYSDKNQRSIVAFVRGSDEEIIFFKSLTGWPNQQPMYPLNFSVPSSVLSTRFPAIGIWNGEKITASVEGGKINYWVVDHLETLTN